MTDWQHDLRSGDPLRDGDQLAAADVVRIRVSVVAAAAGSRAGIRRPLTMVLAASLATVVAAGLWAVRRDDAGHAAVVVNVDAQPGEVPAIERRQLQFSMPGGTRVIWFFDQSFEMR